MIPLQHRAAAATAALDAAKTPMQKKAAKDEGMSLKRDLETHIADENFKAVFKAAQPQNSFGVWSGAPLTIYMVRGDGKKITAPVKLPGDGTMAAPNPQGQSAVPVNLVPAMLRLGFVRTNSVITPLGEKYPVRDPAIPNGT
jgi:hypothetical protein